MINQLKRNHPLLIILSLVMLTVGIMIYQLLGTENAKLNHHQLNVHKNASGTLNSSELTNQKQNSLYNNVVDAKQYEQFWIWTPPRDISKISQAHTLYLLQGEIRPPHPYKQPLNDVNNLGNQSSRRLATLTPQGLGVHKLNDKRIWLVYRATSQDWSPEVMSQIITRLKQWERAGNHVIGIQIDYDAATHKLDRYANLLEDIRKQLPSDYKLSVTGLLDWTNQINDVKFKQLANAIDELVMQTYQGTTTLPNYGRYLAKLNDLPFEFKVGIIEGGDWQGADFLEENPNFKGYVVFLK